MTSAQRVWGIERIANTALGGLALRRFFDPTVGADYGIGRKEKQRLVTAFHRINQNVVSATQWLDYVVLATQILRIPASIDGDIVECGCYKGASSAALSLVAKVVKRTLLVCDSFQGLLDDSGGAHYYPHLRVTTKYVPTLFHGTLPEVQTNISAWGCIEPCRFLQGYFSESLSRLSDPIAFAFLDVDLASSMRDCLRRIWPLLLEGSYIYTDDSCDMAVVKIWFDNDFWSTLECAPPGYVGSGCGLPGLSQDYSSIGYSIKVRNPGSAFKQVTFW